MLKLLFVFLCCIHTIHAVHLRAGVRHESNNIHVVADVGSINTIVIKKSDATEIMHFNITNYTGCTLPSGCLETNCRKADSLSDNRYTVDIKLAYCSGDTILYDVEVEFDSDTQTYFEYIAELQTANGVSTSEKIRSHCQTSQYKNTTDKSCNPCTCEDGKYELCDGQDTEFVCSSCTCDAGFAYDETKCNRNFDSVWQTGGGTLYNNSFCQQCECHAGGYIFDDEITCDGSLSIQKWLEERHDGPKHCQLCICPSGQRLKADVCNATFDNDVYMNKTDAVVTNSTQHVYDNFCEPCTCEEHEYMVADTCGNGYEEKCIMNINHTNNTANYTNKTECIYANHTWTSQLKDPVECKQCDACQEHHYIDCDGTHFGLPPTNTRCKICPNCTTGQYIDCDGTDLGVPPTNTRCKNCTCDPGEYITCNGTVFGSQDNPCQSCGVCSIGEYVNCDGTGTELPTDVCKNCTCSDTNYMDYSRHEKLKQNDATRGRNDCTGEEAMIPYECVPISDVEDCQVGSNTGVEITPGTLGTSDGVCTKLKKGQQCKTNEQPDCDGRCNGGNTVCPFMYGYAKIYEGENTNGYEIDVSMNAAISKIWLYNETRIDNFTNPQCESFIHHVNIGDVVSLICNSQPIASYKIEKESNAPECEYILASIDYTDLNATIFKQTASNYTCKIKKEHVCNALECIKWRGELEDGFNEYKTKSVNSAVCKLLRANEDFELKSQCCSDTNSSDCNDPTGEQLTNKCLFNTDKCTASENPDATTLKTVDQIGSVVPKDVYSYSSCTAYCPQHAQNFETLLCNSNELKSGYVCGDLFVGHANGEIKTWNSELKKWSAYNNVDNSNDGYKIYDIIFADNNNMMYTTWDFDINTVVNRAHRSDQGRIQGSIYMNKLLVNNKTQIRGAFDLDIRGTTVVHASMYEMKEGGTQAFLDTEDITVYFLLDNYIYGSGSTILIIRFLNKNSLAHSPTRGVKFISDNKILVLMDSKYRRWSINSADTRTDVGYSPFFGIVTLVNNTSMQSVFFTAKEDNLNASTATDHTYLSDITNTKAFDLDTTKKHVVLGLSRANPDQISDTGSSGIYSELRTANFCKCQTECNYANNYNDEIKDYWCNTVASCNGQTYGSTPTHWGWCGRKILGGRIAIWSYNRTTDCPTVLETDTTTACAPLKTLKRDEEVKHIMYDKDKEYIIYTQKNKLHRIDINLENDEILYTNTSNDEITSMAFNNDFSRLTFGTKGGTVKTLIYPSGKLEVTNQYSSGIEVSAIAYANHVHGTNTCIHHSCNSTTTLNTSVTCGAICTDNECCS